MIIELNPGNYVIGVSGGVDSIVLLDLLKNQPAVQLVVAHYDHGIRADSKKDRQFVQKIAKQLKLPFVYESGELGPTTSEAMARKRRYEFLEKVRKNNDARAIVTAHHQDDLLETAILNILRGTNRRGLTSLGSGPLLIRPMLHLSKKEILAYAKARQLKWYDDPTNDDERYLRNYVRHQIVVKFQAKQRRQLLSIIEKTRQTNEELDKQLVNLMQNELNLQYLDRTWFISLPHEVAKEFLATWFRIQNIGNYDASTLERIVIAAKVGKAGALIDIIDGVSLNLKKDSLALVGLER
ncbi:MAG: tRNA lysidine(34) synthetase TilS [Candidatus Saccharimonadales bacterium]